MYNVVLLNKEYKIYGIYGPEPVIYWIYKTFAEVIDYQGYAVLNEKEYIATCLKFGPGAVVLR